jgi:hypothetical protein
MATIAEIDNLEKKLSVKIRKTGGYYDKWRIYYSE